MAVNEDYSGSFLWGDEQTGDGSTMKDRGDFKIPVTFL